MNTSSRGARRFARYVPANLFAPPGQQCQRYLDGLRWWKLVGGNSNLLELLALAPDGSWWRVYEITQGCMVIPQLQDRRSAFPVVLVPTTPVSLQARQAHMERHTIALWLPIGVSEFRAHLGRLKQVVKGGPFKHFVFTEDVGGVTVAVNSDDSAVFPEATARLAALFGRAFGAVVTIVQQGAEHV